MPQQTGADPIVRQAARATAQSLARRGPRRESEPDAEPTSAGKNRLDSRLASRYLQARALGWPTRSRPIRPATTTRSSRIARPCRGRTKPRVRRSLAGHQACVSTVGGPTRGEVRRPRPTNRCGSGSLRLWHWFHSLLSHIVLPQRNQKVLTAHNERAVRDRRRGHHVIVHRVDSKQFKVRPRFDDTDFPFLGTKIESSVGRDRRCRVAAITHALSVNLFARLGLVTRD